MPARCRRRKMVSDKIEELMEANQLRELKHYFLWKLSRASKPKGRAL
jgi:hypothetical protein